MKRLVARFVGVYLVLYELPFPLNLDGGVAAAYERLWGAVVPRLARAAFHLQGVSLARNGSSDTTFDYVRLAGLAALAALVTAALSARRPSAVSERRMEQWLWIYLRFALAAEMIAYGSVKVFPSQFRSPPLDRLLETYGSSSPMALLWTFMGASAAYTVFSGGLELLGGLLLTARRTALAGALLCSAVLANVVMLNLCYDVPVKIHSLHLLAMSLFLLAPHVRALADFLVLQRSARLIPPPAPTILEGRARALVLLRTLVVLAFSAFALKRAHDSLAAPAPELYGVWDVDQFRLDGKALPPDYTDGRRWRRLIVPAPAARMPSIQFADDKTLYVRLELNSAGDSLTLQPSTNAAPLRFDCSRPDRETLLLSGRWENRRLQARLRRENPRFLLLERGFHWINEWPYNR